LEVVADVAWSVLQPNSNLEPATLTFVEGDPQLNRRITVPRRLRCQCGGPLNGTASTYGVMNPATGFVEFVERHDPESESVLRHACCRHYYPEVQRGTSRRQLTAFAFGRGHSVEDATRACLAEGIERYSAVWQGTEPMVVARFDDAGLFVDPSTVLLFSDTQYRDRENWNAAADARFHVPEPFEQDGVTFWSPVRSLRDGASRLLPTALCYGGCTGDQRVFGTADSIGCAAGDTLEDAILRALLEKIERDALAIWWYSRAHRPALDCSDLPSPRMKRLLAEIRAKQLRLTVMDITTDIDVATYVAVGTDRKGRHPSFGASANPDPLVAASKAVEEMLQMHYWASRGFSDQCLSRWIDSRTLETDPHLAGHGRIDLRRGCSPGITSPLQWSVEQVWQSGLEAYAVDLTRPEIGLRTARVIIPESRHCWHRLANGRLYSTPVKLGWLPRALAEEELNPVPCPL
jgi:ribosomal protein S12 methylthiotransferase accessory factor